MSKVGYLGQAIQPKADGTCKDVPVLLDSTAMWIVPSQSSAHLPMANTCREMAALNTVMLVRKQEMQGEME